MMTDTTSSPESPDDLILEGVLEDGFSSPELTAETLSSQADGETGSKKSKRSPVDSASGVESAGPAESTTKRKSDRNLPVAIGVAVALIAYIVVTAFWLPIGFVVLVAAALVLGAFEVARAISQAGAKPQLAPIIITILGMSFAPWISRLFSDDIAKALVVLMGSFAVGVVLCLIWRMPRGTDGFIRDASASVFVLGYVGLLGSTATLMLSEPRGAWRIIAFILVNTANDTGAFAVGSAFGKHKVTPKISPNKTWEGLVGGLFFALLAGVACMMLMFDSSWWAGLILGAVVFLLGTCGDLIESMIKRDANVKDMSGFLPGHGGIMDRIDSLLVAAPGAWLVMHLLVP